MKKYKVKVDGLYFKSFFDAGYFNKRYSLGMNFSKIPYGVGILYPVASGCVTADDDSESMVYEYYGYWKKVKIRDIEYFNQILSYRRLKKT